MLAPGRLVVNDNQPLIHAVIQSESHRRRRLVVVAEVVDDRDGIAGDGRSRTSWCFKTFRIRDQATASTDYLDLTRGSLSVRGNGQPAWVFPRVG